MTSSQIPLLRLLNQQIAHHAYSNAGDMVRAVVALQAQDYAGAKWSVGLRVPGMTDADVEQAIADKQIVRTWSMRGTLHFIAPEDVRWINALAGPRILSGAKGLFKKRGLDDKIFMTAHKLLAKELKGNRLLTREQITNLLIKKGIPAEGLLLGHILLQASLSGLICHGPRVGKEYTFALLDEWLPATKPKPRDESIAELTLRYFTSHGPATLKDFAYWAGLSLTDGRAGIESVKNKLHKEVINGEEYWMGKDIAAIKKGSSSVCLLPGFDELLLGYKDRTPSLAAAHNKKVVPYSNGMFSATIIINGQVTGIWKRTVKKDTVLIELQPFTRIDNAIHKKLEKAAGNYAIFMGLKPELSVLE